MGLDSLASGDMFSAAQAFRQVLHKNPQHPEALHGLGLIACQSGQLDDAVACLTQAAQLQPENAIYAHNLGEACRQSGLWDQAQQAFEKAVALNPQFAQAHNNLANVFYETENYPQAVKHYQLAIALKHDFSPWLTNLGNAHKQLRQYAEAIDCYQRALALDHDAPEPKNMLAMMHRALGDYALAQETLEQVLAVHDDYVMAMNNLAIVLKERGQLDQSIAWLHQALEIRPDFTQAVDTLGSVYLAGNQTDKALACFDRAIEARPDQPGFYFNRALTYLTRGQYPLGFKEYEWRFKHDIKLKRDDVQPRWEGQQAPTQTLLLYGEQGLGDTLQFLRYAKYAKQRVGRVVLDIQPQLHLLCQNLPGIDALLSDDAFACESYDLQAPLLSLPYLLDSQLGPLADDVPYLQADVALVEVCQGLLGEAAGVKVGIHWQGNHDFAMDRFRSMSLAPMLPLTQVAGASLVSLQHGQAREAIKKLRVGPSDIFDMGHQLDQYSVKQYRHHGARDSHALRLSLQAAAITCLDLVITTDTMFAHLAGSLGKAVWLLVSSQPDWRWQFDRFDNDWYPTMHIFRQTQWGDWEPVIEQVQEALVQVVQMQADGQEVAA